MARVWQLLVRADGDTKAAQKEIRSLQRSTKQFGQKVSGMGRTLTTAVTAPIVALGALGVSELRETMAVTQRTDAVFKSMGSSMVVTKGQLSKLVGELENYSAIEGDIIQNAANVGLSFKALAGNPKLFQATTRAAVDMSAALGQDLQTTMTQLGKAMQGGAKGAAALGKNGTLAKDDIEKLQAMAKAGVPLWKQQEFILAAVNKQYAGQGKNVDPIKQITIAVKNTAEALAVLLLPAITKVSAWLQKLATWVQGLNKDQQKWVGIALLVAAALGPVLMALGSMIGAMSGLIAISGIAIAPLLAVVAAVAAVTAVLVIAYKQSEDFRTLVNAIAKVALVALKLILQGVVLHFTAMATVIVTVARVARDMALAINTAVRQALGWVRDNAAACWSAVNNAIDKARDYAVALGGALANAVRAGIAWVRDNAAACWNAVNGKIDAARDAAAALGSALSNSVQNGLEWIRNKAAGAWSGFETAAGSVKSIVVKIANALETVVSALTTAVSKAGDLAGKMGGIPGAGKLFADGGIVTRATSAIIGEAGPEAVVPLGSSTRATANRNRVMQQANLVGYGAAPVGGSLTVHVHPQSGDPEAIARRVVQIIGSRRVAMGGAL